MFSLKNFDWTKIKYVINGIVVGAIVSIVVSLFRFIISVALDFTETSYAFLRDNPIWILGWLMLSIIIGFILTLLLRDEPNIQGSGIQDIEGQLQGAIQLKWPSVLWRKFVGSVLSIGSGLALGREGPSIQIGGVIGQGVNYFLKGDSTQQNLLVSSGAAAGLAAAFNTPVSGILFVAEEIHKKFSNILLLSAFSASVTANFITYRLLSIEPAIDLSPLAIFPLDYYNHLIILGIFLAACGGFYQKVTLYMPKIYEKLPIPSYLRAFVPILLVIPVGLFLPDMLGGGESLISLVSESPIRSITTLALIIGFRFIFMHISYGSGLPGGIFLPVLSLGALLGAFFSNAALNLTGIPEVYLNNFVVYSMGGLLTSITKAPLMSVMLIVEMTGRINHLMPLAVVCLTSYVTADFLRSGPIYEVLLERKLDKDPSIFEGKIEEFNIIVEPNSQLDGMVIRDLRMPGGSQLVRIERYQTEFIPRSDTVMMSNDTLYAQTDSGLMNDAQKYMNQLNTENENPP